MPIIVFTDRIKIENENLYVRTVKATELGRGIANKKNVALRFVDSFYFFLKKSGWTIFYFTCCL